MDHILEVKELRVSFPTPRGIIHAVNGISYAIRKGETMGIIGESGSGKSVGAYSILGLLKPPGRVDGGQILYKKRDTLTMVQQELESIRGREIGMIFQDPVSFMDPVFTIGKQMTEVLRRHIKGLSAVEAECRSEEMLHTVGVREADRRFLKRYPFELSGGQCQRVMIAIALLCGPKLLIADEPTTALDVTIQAQIIRLLKEMQRQRDMAMVYITHNISIVAEICDMVSIMYGGYILEQAAVDDIFYRAAHPYTMALLEAVPHMDAPRKLPMRTIVGDPVNPACLPDGCVYHPRCRYCNDICRRETPPWTVLGESHSARCWRLSSEGER
jgi:oligopeptide transport system ATP-binding protein